MIAPNCRRCSRFTIWHPEPYCDCDCHRFDASRGIINSALIGLMFIALAVAIYNLVT